MKLLYCSECEDIFKLDFDKRSCKCGEVSGQYKNNIDAEVNGNGFSLAIGNGSLWKAIQNLVECSAEKNRDEYIKECKVTCWVRPHCGTGNPHTKRTVYEQKEPAGNIYQCGMPDDRGEL